MRKDIRESRNLGKGNNYHEEMKLKIIIAQKTHDEQENKKHNFAAHKQHIQAFFEISFPDPNYPPLLERAAYIERQSSEILEKITRRIRDITAVIQNKQTNARNLRKENKILGGEYNKIES